MPIGQMSYRQPAKLRLDGTVLTCMTRNYDGIKAASVPFRGDLPMNAVAQCHTMSSGSLAQAPRASGTRHGFSEFQRSTRVKWRLSHKDERPRLASVSVAFFMHRGMMKRFTSHLYMSEPRCNDKD